MFPEKAKRIWADAPYEVNTYRRFYAEFDAESGRNYDIKLACDSNYALYLNGRLVNFGQYADFEDMRFYDTLSLDKFVKDGKNELTIDVYYQGASSSTYRHGSAGLIFEVTSDAAVVLFSDESVLTCPLSTYASGNAVELVTGQLGYSFRYDSRIENKLSAPTRALPIPAAPLLLPRPIKKLDILPPTATRVISTGSFIEAAQGKTGERMQSAFLSPDENALDIQLREEGGFEPRAQENASGCYVLLDLGREEAGVFTIDIELPVDAEILIGWGEHLTDMRPRTAVGGRNFAASYYGKKGRNTFTHPFRRLGCRYIQLNIYASSAKLNYAGLLPTEYPLARTKAFTCADKLHKMIYEVSLRTLHLCMHEHYEDCPWREQALYTMDSRNQMLCGYYIYDDRNAEFARASLRLMAHSIRCDNLLELCMPAEVFITIPGFSAIYPTAVCDYLKFTGDTEFVREVLPTAKRIMEGFIRRLDNEYGLIACYTEREYWNFYEWQPTLEGVIGGVVKEADITYDAPLCALVSMGLRALADICSELGDDSASYYSARQLALNKAINEHFYDSERGAYHDFMRLGERFGYSEYTNSLIVYAEAAPEAELPRVLASLVSGDMIEATLSSRLYLYEALMRMPEKYGRFVFDDIAEKWGYMLRQGATAFWETIRGDADFAGGGSLCHGWSAIPAYFYLKYALSLPPEITGIYKADAN